MRSLTMVFFLVLGLVVATSAGASSFTTLILPGSPNSDISTWTNGVRYTALPPGTQTWNDVPFDLVRTSDNHVWAYMYSLTIPANVFGVTKAYSIINSGYGYSGTKIGEMEFFGTGGAYYKKDLVEGNNVRDHLYGGYNNTIDGVTAVPALVAGPGQARLDMQIYDLPAVFATNTLTSVKFNYMGQGYGGNPFLAAATVEATAVPVPAAVWLLGPGLAGLVALRRRITG